MFTCPVWWPAKFWSQTPTAQLPSRPQLLTKFHYSSWQERSPHPQPGLNKHPSDITSCRLQNSPGLPTSDHKVPGHAGPSGQGGPAHGTLHTLKQPKQKPQSRKAPHSHLCQMAWPLPPCPLRWEAQSPLPQCQPSPQRQPHGALAAASLRADSGPTRTPHHSHCFKSSRHKAMRAGWGSETQRPAKTERGKGRDTGAERRGDRGLGQRKRGEQELWAKEQVQKGAFSARDSEW